MEKLADSKFIFVIGIGGSDLASKAVWNALNLNKKTDKKIFFLEAPDYREYDNFKVFFENEITDLEKVALIAISKSGQTKETLETFHKIFDMLSEKFGQPVAERTLIISSPGSTLWSLAESKGIQKLAWEGDVGGRFSAFTIAHTAVLSIAGLNTKKFKDGSHFAASDTATQDEQSMLAQKIFESYKKGAKIIDFFLFNPELEDLGKWCRQLIAESLATFTPTVSLGPTDLHSMLELYLEKPDERFTIFVKSEKEIDESVNEVSYENVTSEYHKRGLSLYKYEMPEINEFELGKFMQFMINLTLDLAKLLEVNPYDQPEVEKYKDSLRNS